MPHNDGGVSAVQNHRAVYSATVEAPFSAVFSTDICNGVPSNEGGDTHFAHCLYIRREVHRLLL
jgi:hypothetical protein